MELVTTPLVITDPKKYPLRALDSRVWQFGPRGLPPPPPGVSPPEQNGLHRAV
jgi:hypothetical protein